MVIRRTVLLGVLIVVVCAAAAQEKPTGDKVPAPRTIAASGKQTYMHYCASCHGVDSRGDGPAAVILKTTPPDLTTLAKRLSRFEAALEPSNSDGPMPHVDIGEHQWRNGRTVLT